MMRLEGSLLKGSYTPVVTPIGDGRVDLGCFAALVRRQFAGGSQGVVVTGTTGEPSLLSAGERRELLEAALGSAGGGPVVAATGCQTLADTLELCAHAEQAGAAALLVVTPYYIRPPQRGLVEYFRAVCASTELPVLAYHIPGRAAVSLELASIVAIAKSSPNFVGMKHASSDLGLVTKVIEALGTDFRLFVGLEEMSFPMLAIGACGMMNAVGNLVPSAVADLWKAVDSGDLAEGRRLHYELAELNEAVFWDINPIPIKYLMWRLGLLATDEHRLPMVPPTPELAARLDDLLARSPVLAKAGDS